MSATSTGTVSLASFWQVWHQLWTTTYPTDEESNEAGRARRVLTRHVMQTPGASVADVLVKVKILREQERDGKWVDEDKMLASIIADLERLAGGGAGA